jgi:hypothetical protein
MDRIETIYGALTEMARVHGSIRPERFGGGLWNFDEEVKIWRGQIIGHEEENGYEPLTPLQWSIISRYIDSLRLKLGLKKSSKKLVVAGKRMKGHTTIVVDGEHKFGKGGM